MNYRDKLNKLLSDFNQAFYDRGWENLATYANPVEFKNNKEINLFTISRHFFLLNPNKKSSEINLQYPPFPKSTDCQCLEVVIMELIKIYKEDWFKEYTKKINAEATSYPPFISHYKEYYKKDGMYFYFFDAYTTKQKFLPSSKYKIVFNEIENQLGEIDKLEVLIYYCDKENTFDNIKSYYYDMYKYVIGVDIAI